MNSRNANSRETKYLTEKKGRVIKLLSGLAATEWLGMTQGTKVAFSFPSQSLGLDTCGCCTSRACFQLCLKRPWGSSVWAMAAPQGCSTKPSTVIQLLKCTEILTADRERTGTETLGFWPWNHPLSCRSFHRLRYFPSSYTSHFAKLGDNSACGRE